MAERNLNIDWKQYYKDHLCSMEEAAKAVKPGDCIWVGEASSIPYTFLDELYKHKEDYHDVTIYSNVFNQPADMIFDPEAKKYFRQITSYNLPLERMSIGMNVMECGSIGYDKLGDAPFVYGCNAGATYINPPDENGWCNVGVYGVSTNIINYNNPRIKKVFGFIDATGQPPVRGDNLEWTSIHVTQLDYIVEQNTEIMEIPSAPPTQVDKDIASYILPLLKSGDKVEIGFGGLGEEIMANLKSRAPLEVITEVACDNMMNLVEEGILTKVIACSPGACSTEFYHWASGNDKMVFMPQPIMLDPAWLGQQENLVSINATFMCDLLGQCCSEAQGLMPYSGAGGSFSYIYGATLAKNGRSFICLRSTYVDHDGETHSNIVPWLPEGSIVTTPKNFVMYIVSEWGLADCYLRTCKDRIRALIKIAHPDFRKELMEKIVTTPLIKEDDLEGYDPFDNIKK